ncbi:hypothetical protein J5690_06560 [bacterium]|nr:hypothetical protein [bacterium]
MNIKQKFIEIMKEKWREQIFTSPHGQKLSDDDKKHIYDFVSMLAEDGFNQGYRFAHDEQKIVMSAVAMAVELAGKDLDDEELEATMQRMSEEFAEKIAKESGEKND